MIQKQTVVKIIDNSGGLKARVIHTYKQKFPKIGDLIKVTITHSQSQKKSTKVKKGQIYLARVVLTKKLLTRKNGIQVGTGYNGIVILKEDLTPLANRILLSLPFEMKRYPEVFSLAPQTI